SGLEQSDKNEELTQFYAHQFRHHRPLLPGVAPDGDRMQVLEGVEVAFVHCLLFVEINLAYEVAIIAADDIRIIFGHFEKPHYFYWGETDIVGRFRSKCTKAVSLGDTHIWPIVPKHATGRGRHKKALKIRRPREEASGL